MAIAISHMVAMRRPQLRWFINLVYLKGFVILKKRLRDENPSVHTEAVSITLSINPAISQAEEELFIIMKLFN